MLWLVLTWRLVCNNLTDMSVSKRNKEATEASLLESAIAVFQEVGYAKARVSDIVSRSGLSQGTFYLYFKSKEDVLRRILDDFREEMNHALESVENVFAGESSAEVLASLTEFLEQVLIIHQENIGAAEIVWREGFGHGGIFAQLYTETYSFFLEIVQQRMREAMEKGLIRRESIREASVFLVSIFERSSFYFMVIEGDVDIPKLAATMARFILYGLLPESKTDKIPPTNG